MYEQFFRFTRTPFRIHSEPDLFYAGESHQRAISCLKETIKNNKAVVTLFGLPGTGKTTLVHKAIDESLSSGTVVYRVNKAHCADIRRSIADELCDRLVAQDTKESIVPIEKIYSMIAHANRNIVLVIDEAQLLSQQEVSFIHEFAAFDDVYDTAIKMILIGHIEARDVVNLEQQGVNPVFHITHCHLEPLSQNETKTYIKHRLLSSGWKDDPKLDQTLFDLTFKLTGGIPRQINAFFDRLLQFMEFESLHALSNDDLKAFCVELHQDLKGLENISRDEQQILNRLEQAGKILSSNTPSTSSQAVKPPIIDETKKPEKSLSEKSSTQPKTSSAENTSSTATVAAKVTLETTPKPEPMASEESESDATIVSSKASDVKNSPTPSTAADDKAAPVSSEPVARGNDEEELEKSSLNGINAKLKKLNKEIDDGNFAQLNEAKKVTNLPGEKLVKNSEQHSAGVPEKSSKPDKKPVISFTNELMPSSSSASSQRSPSRNEASNVTPINPKKKNDEKQNLPPVAEKIEKPGSSNDEMKKDSDNAKEKASGGGAKFGAIAAGMIVAGVALFVSLGGEESASNTITVNRQAAEPTPVVVAEVQPETLKDSSEFALFEADKTEAVNDQPIAERAPEISPTAPSDEQAVAQTSENVERDVAEKIETQEKEVAQKADDTSDINGKTVATSGSASSNSRQAVANKRPVTKANPTQKVDQAKAERLKAMSEKREQSNRELAKAKKQRPEKRVAEKKKVVVKIVPESQPVKAKKIRETAPVVVAALTKTDVAPPNNPPVIPKKEPTKPVDKLPEIVVHEKELRGMMMSFKWFYESGDIGLFGKLFTEDARTNDNVGRAAIQTDYGQLFAATDRRRIEVKNMNWKTKGKIAIGNGLFKLIVVNSATGESSEVNGQILVRAEKENEKQRPKIKGLFYNYSLASTE